MTYQCLMRPDSPATAGAIRLFLDRAERRLGSFDADTRAELAGLAVEKAYARVRRKEFVITMGGSGLGQSDAAWWRPMEDGQLGGDWHLNQPQFSQACRDVIGQRHRSREEELLDAHGDALAMEAFRRRTEDAILLDVESAFLALDPLYRAVIWTAPRTEVTHFASDRFKPDFDFGSHRLRDGERQRGVPDRVALWADTEEHDKPLAPTAAQAEARLFQIFQENSREQ